MREGFDREIDLLLRRRARGTPELRPWGDGAGDDASGAHLDADELGAFAEGALPAGARFAAASHLADCERCRGVVVGLARVADAGGEVKQQAVAVPASAESARPSAWRALVASLFAPRVMRLAVPVLALSLVGVVSYVALRTDKGALQAPKQNSSQADAALQAPAAPLAATESAANANAAGIVESIGNTAPSHEAQGSNASVAQTRGHGLAEVPPAEAPEEAQPSAAAPAPPPPPAAAAPEGPADLSRAAPKTATTGEGETARADNRERSESRDRDKSARASEPSEDVASNDAVQRRGQSRAANEVQMPDGSARNQSKRAADNNASSGYGNVAGAGAAPSKEKESDSGRAGARSETAARARAPKQEERKADDEPAAQTRIAAGHRFRRVDNAWVDVNYKSSMPSTGVRRGTEEFRALVADMPEIGRIAAAVSGAVTVVIGGRAYHIR